MSISYTLITKKLGGRDGLVADNPTMEQVSTGLHGTCSKSQIRVTDNLWLLQNKCKYLEKGECRVNLINFDHLIYVTQVTGAITHTPEEIRFSPERRSS